MALFRCGMNTNTYTYVVGRNNYPNYQLAIYNLKTGERVLGINTVTIDGITFTCNNAFDSFITSVAVDAMIIFSGITYTNKTSFNPRLNSLGNTAADDWYTLVIKVH